MIQEELNELKIKHSFTEEIEELIKQLKNERYHNGRPLNENEKLEIIEKAIRDTAAQEIKTNKTVIALRKFIKLKTKSLIPHLVNITLNSTGTSQGLNTTSVNK